MKKNILLLLFMLIFVACETGTRYDKNATKQEVPKEIESGLVTHDINSLFEEEDEVERREAFDDKLHPIVFADDEPKEVSNVVDTFDGGEISNNLDVQQIREGKHGDYVRLVFDIYDAGEKAKNVGDYSAKYYREKNDITVVLNGYRKFSASLPSFSVNSPIEQIYFENYLDDSAYKFHLKLRDDAKVRIFDLQNPARLVFDIKPI